MAKKKNERAKEDAGFWIGFDLGGTKMLAVAVNAKFKAIGRCRRKTKGHEGAEVGLDRIQQTINGAIENAGLDRRQLRGIGIGCPGPLDLAKGVIQDAPNLGWKNVPVKAALQTRFGCPVVVANDVDLGVYGEFRFGAGQGARCVVGIFPGTGIGGGCVFQGNILQGSNCTCMEIGHIPVLPGGPLDGCGNAGTLESVASRLAIAGSAAQAAYRGQAPFLLQQIGTDLSEIRSGVLAESIRQGDRAVEQIVEHAADQLALAVVTLVHLLAPDTVVLGGGLVEAMPELFVTRIKRAVRARVLPAFRDVFKVAAAQLGDDATVMGAAAWAAKCTAVQGAAQ